MRNFFYRIIYGTSIIYVFFLLVLSMELVVSEIPDHVYVRRGEENEFYVDFPFVITDIESDETENLKKRCSILGIIPVKDVTVSVVDKTEYVYASGEIVGLYTKCAGVFVIDVCEIEGKDGTFHNPTEGTIHTGDYILAINDEVLTCKEDMVRIVDACKGNALTLYVYRDGEIRKEVVRPAKDKAGDYKMGIWVKDDLAGIGTITYVTQTGDFGALGHGMSNGENRDLLMVGGGDLFESKILGIQLGQRGNPGEVKGIIRYGSNAHLGKVDLNTGSGIFGEIDTDNLNSYIVEENRYVVAYKQEIKVGKAYIISEISGKREKYEIEITYVDYLSLHSNKGLHIKVTDPKLLALTGGIVQGMSGSPIIQNDKIVGAVTHVLINDPTQGYGIFIEEMLETAN